MVTCRVKAFKVFQVLKIPYWTYDLKDRSSKSFIFLKKITSVDLWNKLQSVAVKN